MKNCIYCGGDPIVSVNCYCREIKLDLLEVKQECCKRCGAELRMVQVRVPRPPVLQAFASQDNTSPSLAIDTGYETRTEVADCVRCTGAY